MLNFQTDYDEATGEQVLTCFLLPQMEYQAEQMGKLSKKISVGVRIIYYSIKVPRGFCEKKLSALNEHLVISLMHP